jgi:hypothetical protein
VLNGFTGSGQSVFELERDDFERIRDALVIIGRESGQEAILVASRRRSVRLR